MSPSRTRRVLPLLTVALAAVAVATVLALLSTGGGLTAGTPPSGEPAQDDPVLPTSGVPAATPAPVPVTWQQAGTAFLERYLDPDGRVVRHDQGGDTVSEGQAYAMLVAVALQDRERFDLAWGWTRSNLVRPEDGLLSWRWSGGRVVDSASASDADLDAARALLLAGRRFEAPELVREGVALGRAVLDHETVEVEQGRILVAGTWAQDDPYAYNPSYASPVATALLAEEDDDRRWAELDAGTRAVTRTLLEEVDLPPDWSQVRRDGRVEPMPGAAGRGGEGVRYGYDAARLPLRFAESCKADDVELAGALAAPLARFPGAPAARDLGGQPLTTDESVLAAAAQAASAAADGQPALARAELDRLAELDQRSPTYYGSAWHALSRLLLTTEELAGCPSLPV